MNEVQTIFPKCGTRMKYHYPVLKSDEVQIGHDGDIVFSVHFRNDGVHSLMKVGTNGVYYTLRPGEEKEFAVSPPYAMEETYKVLYEFENQSSWETSGAQLLTDEECEALMVHRSIIGELYLHGVPNTI